MFEGFDNNFDGVLIDANLKYQQKKREYGESWKNVSKEQLMQRLLKEIEELKDADTNTQKYKETIDVVNISLMLACRIIRDEVKPNSSQG